jgi:hypothetical protein
MEQTNDISAAESGDIAFDGVEIAGLVVPVVFAIMTIVLVAIAPDSTTKAPDVSKSAAERIELRDQIQER